MHVHVREHVHARVCVVCVRAHADEAGNDIAEVPECLLHARRFISFTPHDKLKRRALLLSHMRKLRLREVR